MARIRTIKPDFFLDEDLSELPFHVRIFYQGLWCQADKSGRLEDRPKFLKSQIFPYDDIDVDECLKTLSANKSSFPEPYIVRYEVEGRKYIQILKFEEHQRPHHTEKDSTIPPLPDGYGADKKRLGDRKKRVGREGKGREGKGREEEAPGKPGLSDAEYIDHVKTEHNRMMDDPKETAEWRSMYNGTLDIDRTLYAACTWLVDNPHRRKTKLKQFYGNWLRNNFQRANP